MNIKRAFKNERLLKSLIGMRQEELECLLITFEKLIIEAAKKKKRKREAGAGRHGVLKNAKEKLFFILLYMKVYPTYDVISFIFQVDRAQPCRWVKKFLPLLEKTLGRSCVLPKRRINSVEEFFKQFPEAKDIFIDGTECNVQRPKSKKKQSRKYSGKKKRHTRKHLIVTDYKKRVLLVSPAKDGRRHDKRCLDKTTWLSGVPPGTTIWVDTGFCGIEHGLNQNVSIMRPKKSSKRNPLTQVQKKENHDISSIRIVVENAISGIKRFNSLSHIFRNRKGQDDQFFLIASGLWNLHLQFTQ